MIVNGNVDLVSTSKIKVCMGLDKNIVVCLKKTEMQDNIFLNFSDNKSEIMLNKKGGV